MDEKEIGVHIFCSLNHLGLGDTFIDIAGRLAINRMFLPILIIFDAQECPIKKTRVHSSTHLNQDMQAPILSLFFWMLTAPAVDIISKVKGLIQNRLIAINAPMLPPKSS